MQCGDLHFPTSSVALLRLATLDAPFGLWIQQHAKGTCCDAGDVVLWVCRWHFWESVKLLGLDR